MFGIQGVLEGSAAPEAFRATIGRNEKGEKLAGPALNPLKGSSANFSHSPTASKFDAICNSFSCNAEGLGGFVKMHHHPRKFTCQVDPVCPFLSIGYRAKRL